MDEKVLVVPTKEFELLKEGFTPINTLLDWEKVIENGLYKKRAEMEKNENFRQIIPYIAFKKDDLLFSYARSKKGNENRLHEKYSLGVGGHIDEPDTLMQAAEREVEEELGIDISADDLEVVGFIKLNDSQVSRVHLGVAMVYNLKQDLDISSGEIEVLVDRKFRNKNETEELLEKMETWSQIFYDEYLKDSI